MGNKLQRISASATQIYPPPSASSHQSHHTRNSHSHSSSSSSSQPPPTSTTLYYDLPPTSPVKDPGSTCYRSLRVLSLARLGLTLLIIAAAAAVVGCEAHALSVYNGTRLGEGWAMPGLWPVGLDMRGTQALVVGGSVVALAGLACLIVGVVPVPQRFQLLIILFSMGLSVVGLAGAVFGVAYSESVTRGLGAERDQIQSWTCRWAGGAADANKLFDNGLAGIVAPQGFQRVCMETHVGFSLLALLICVQTVVVAVTAVCTVLELRMRKLEKTGTGEGSGEKDALARRFY